VKDDVMRCSCCWPIAHLLPCRHVCALNVHKFRTPFLKGQVGLRWLKAYMPPPHAPVSLAAVPEALPIVAATPPLSLPPNPSADFPSRTARFGQLMGFCNTICTRAAEYKEIFYPVLKWLTILTNWVEASTSGTGYATTSQSQNSSSSSSPSSSFPELPVGFAGMHPSVSVDQLTLPEHRKKKRGRDAQARQQGKGERAQKKAYKPNNASASQQ